MRVYFLMMPIMLLAIVVLGWFAAGRALQPLQQVVQAAQVVSAGNLALRLSLHGTGDELDQLIQTFNSMMERLDASFEQVRQFSLDASHELRTPITAIRGQLEVALLTAQSNEQYREAIETALQDVEKLAKIVKTLLLLAQAESGQVLLQKTTVDLSAAVDELANQFRLVADEKNIVIHTELPPACPVEADRVQFDRLLSNLLSNAVKYTQRGGEVRVTLSREDGQAQLTVSDNGPGIPAQHLPHIFERFYRVRRGERDPEKGVGLGLAFVAWIVKAHGGRIEASSEAGQGTAFRVWLPAGAPPQPPPAPAARPLETHPDACTD